MPNLKISLTREKVMNKIFANERDDSSDDLKHLYLISTDLMCVAGADGMFQRVNPAFEKILGYSYKELLSRPIFDFIHPDDRDHSREAIAKVVAGETIIACENRYQKKDGDYVWISWNGKGIGERVYCIGRDISQTKDTEQQLMIESAKLCTLGEMALGIGHEIKNPVTIIHLLTNKMKKQIHQQSLEPADLNKVACKIEQATLRIDKIVNGLKTLARNGTGDPFIAHDLHIMVNDMVEVFQDQLKKNNIKFEASFSSEEVTIDCRSSQIAQVILNLISNSCDAIKNSEERWIKLETKAYSEFVTLSITDSGKGIPDHLQRKIFESFYTSKAAGEGTGLGLSISKKIVESHNGTLAIDTTSQNTKFVLTFKRSRIQLPA